MEPNKIHERVLEIQKNISNLSPEQQTEMLGELLDLASKLEQSLSEIKIEDNGINPIIGEKFFLFFNRKIEVSNVVRHC